MKLYKYAFFLMSLAIFAYLWLVKRGKIILRLPIVWAKENKLEEALAEYTKAIEANVNLSEAYYGRGSVYLGQRKSWKKQL